MRFLTYEGLSPGPLAEKFDKVRAAVERGDLKSPDVKKLHVGPYYRAKLDAAARLLLQFVSYRGETACLALEILANHDYAKSRFLRGAPVDETKLVEPPVEASGLGPDTMGLRYLHPSRAVFHLLDRPLSFDDAQDEILRRRPPLMVVGSAGSGKTALMLQKLRSQPGRVAYVTESPWLAQTARTLYVAHDFDPGEQEIDFLSYTQLLESVEVPAGRPLTFRDFRAWFERHRSKLKFVDAHRCFEELRGVITADPSGVLSLEAYQALGVRQSILAPEQRDELFALLPAWRRWMDESKLYEPNLIAHAYLTRMTPRYDFVVVDEVQDLTQAQLSLVLRALKTPGNFLLGGDANQIVHPNFFSWAKIKSLFWQGVGIDEGRDIVSLNVSYRNSEAVTRVSNAVLKLKHARFGSVDRESTYLMQAVQGIDGEVRGFKSDSKAIGELDTRARASTRVAVVVLREEHKAEARAKFHTPLIFSIHEAKGLEYENVILYRLVSSERQVFAELCDDVSDADMQRDSLEYRRAKDKADRSLEAFKFYINALYVALTRAVVNVWLVEDDEEHLLLKRLEVPFRDAPIQAHVAKSTTEDWQREAHRLEQQGKYEQAEAIRSQVLHLSPVPWTVLEEPALRLLAQKALDPRGVSSKARSQLFDYACLHHDTPLAQKLAALGFAPAKDFRANRSTAVRRMLQPYEAKNFKTILWETEKYGVDFRTPNNLTPLMLAACAGNLPLVEALVDRGARIEARDHLGQLPLHWALRRAYVDAAFVGGSFGAIYDTLAPASFDVQVEGRLVQVGRELGEYYLFHALFSQWALYYRAEFGRMAGWSAKDVVCDHFQSFPETVVRENRRKRTYVNHVFARSEADSSYPSSRKLWRRERTGHYTPNADVSLRVTLPDGTETWRPVLEVLNVSWLESQLTPGAWGRISPDVLSTQAAALGSAGAAHGDAR